MHAFHHASDWLQEFEVYKVLQELSLLMFAVPCEQIQQFLVLIEDSISGRRPRLFFA